MALTKKDLQQIHQLIQESNNSLIKTLLPTLIDQMKEVFVTKEDASFLLSKDDISHLPTKDDISHLPTKEEFYSMEDKLLHEVISEREENTIQQHQLNNHQQRLN